MSTSKAQALTSSLLARKGGAEPSFVREMSANAPHEERSSVVHDLPSGHISIPSGKVPRVKLSLRLDHERHLRIKLAAAHTGRHVQDIIVEALDMHLEDLAPSIKSSGCTCYGKAPQDGDR